MPTVVAPAVSVSAPHILHSDPPPNKLVRHVSVLPGCSVAEHLLVNASVIAIDEMQWK